MTGAGFCTRCGAQRREGSRFCPSCGLDLQETGASAIPPASATPGLSGEAGGAGGAGGAPIPPNTLSSSWPTPGRGGGSGGSAGGGGSLGSVGGATTRFGSGRSRSGGTGGRGRLTGCLVQLVLGFFALVVFGWAIDLIGGGSTDASPGPSLLDSFPVDSSFRLDASPDATEPAVESSEAGAQPTAVPLPRAIELRKALAAGEVAVTGKGMNLEQLSLTVTSKAADTIRVVINAGTVLHPGASGTQSMVVITKVVLTLEPGQKETETLEVACAEMNLDTPSATDSFRVDTKGPPSDLNRLLASSGFTDQEFRIKQFAIWTITDNPAQGGYVGLGYYGVGSGPSDKELAAIRTLFKAAGIDTTKYRALR